jgi:uncharacterized membrane protein
LGANAILNRRILQALSQWKATPWRADCVTTGFPPRNVYHSYQFRTVREVKAPSADAMFKAVSRANVSTMTLADRVPRRHPIECSVFERHALQLIQDAVRLDESFEHEANDVAVSSVDKKSGATASIKNAFRQSLASVRQQSLNGSEVVASSDSSLAGRNKENVLMGLSLQDMIKSIAEDSSTAVREAAVRAAPSLSSSSSSSSSSASTSSAAGPSEGGSGRASAFALSAEFGQEASGVIGAGGSSADTAMRALAQTSLSSTSGKQGEDLTSARAAEAMKLAAARRAKQEMEEQEREAELESLRAQLQASAALVETLDRQQADAISRVRQVESEVAGIASVTEELENEILLKRKTLEMLPSAGDNIAKLQDICGASAKKLMSLAQEWEAHRRPLIEQLRDVMSIKARRRAQCKQMVEDMKRYRTEMVAMMQDLKDKQDRAAILNEELNKLPKNINRALYTHRILDIINSITKQSKEVEKITSDIRDLQKSISSATATVQRADAIAEETIYSAANAPSPDPVVVDLYRQLKTLRSRFETLVETVNKIGNHEKAAHDLETKIEQETTRVSVNNANRIKADLDLIRAENAQLVAEVKSLSGRA